MAFLAFFFGGTAPAAPEFSLNDTRQARRPQTASLPIQQPTFLTAINCQMFPPFAGMKWGDGTTPPPRL
jgi:hypothetical protein